MTETNFRKGFTLIEALVVTTILGLLAAMLFPVFAKVREKGRSTSCLANERQLGLAISQYTSDNDERFPSEGDAWISQCFPYAKGLGLLRCPDDPTRSYFPGQGIPGYYTDSYGMNSNLVGSTPARRPVTAIADLTAPALTTLLFEVAKCDSAVTLQKPPITNGSATGNGGYDCTGDNGATGLNYPCGVADNDSTSTLSGPRYATGNLGGRILNGTLGSIPRHGDGANFVACDGHAIWLRPDRVSGGKDAVATDCNQGTEPQQPIDCRRQTEERAAGTGHRLYTLTFSSK